MFIITVARTLAVEGKNEVREPSFVDGVVGTSKLLNWGEGKLGETASAMRWNGVRHLSRQE